MANFLCHDPQKPNWCKNLTRHTGAAIGKPASMLQDRNAAPHHPSKACLRYRVAPELFSTRLDSPVQKFVYRP